MIDLIIAHNMRAKQLSCLVIFSVRRRRDQGEITHDFKAHVTQKSHYLFCSRERQTLTNP